MPFKPAQSVFPTESLSPLCRRGHGGVEPTKGFAGPTGPTITNTEPVGKRTSGWAGKRMAPEADTWQHQSANQQWMLN